VERTKDIAGSSLNRARILYVHHDPGIGGASNSLLCLLEGLDRQHFVPLVVLPNRGPLEDRLKALDVEVMHGPVPTFYHMEHSTLKPWHPHILARSVLSAPGAADWIRRTVGLLNVSLVHVNGSMMIAGAAGARRAGVPVVWHVREVLSRGSSGMRQSIVCNQMRANADVLIAVSRAVAERLPADSDLRVVYNGIDVESFRRGADGVSIRRQFGIPAGVPLYGYVSPIYGAKGCYDFVECARQIKSRVPEAEFLVAGKTPEKAALNLLGDNAVRQALERRVDGVVRMQRLAAQYGLDECMHFVGHRRDVASLFDAMDVMIFPSIGEALGRVLLEAGSMQRPAVAYRSGGTSEVIEHGVTGFLASPGDVRSMADYAVTLARDPELRCRVGTAAEQRIRTIFTSTQMIDNIQGIYRELIENGSRASWIKKVRSIGTAS
jgi:glycosyltransferase involved in cell wall biosynthesis